MDLRTELECATRRAMDVELIARTGQLATAADLRDLEAVKQRLLYELHDIKRDLTHEKDKSALHERFSGTDALRAPRQNKNASSELCKGRAPERRPSGVSCVAELRVSRQEQNGYKQVVEMQKQILAKQSLRKQSREQTAVAKQMVVAKQTQRHLTATSRKGNSSTTSEPSWAWRNGSKHGSTIGSTIGSRGIAAIAASRARSERAR